MITTGVLMQSVQSYTSELVSVVLSHYEEEMQIHLTWNTACIKEDLPSTFTLDKNAHRSMKTFGAI